MKLAMETGNTTLQGKPQKSFFLVARPLRGGGVTPIFIVASLARKKRLLILKTSS